MKIKSLNKSMRPFLPESINTIDICTVMSIVFQGFKVRTENIQETFDRWTGILTPSLINVQFY